MDLTTTLVAEVNGLKLGSMQSGGQPVKDKGV